MSFRAKSSSVLRPYSQREHVEHYCLHFDEAKVNET